MGMGPIVWTCLALSLHQSPNDTWYMATRNLGLPLSSKDQKRTDIQQFILLYSSDQGKTWEQGETKLPGDAKPFAFHAPKDGVYWFLVQKVDRANIVSPRDPNREKPNQVVIVDTRPPQVKVTAERLPNGLVRAHWKAWDEYPDPGSLRLEYLTSAHRDGQPTPVAAALVVEGDKEFDPGADGKTGEVRIRVQMKDRAGNVGEDVCGLPATAVSVAASTPPSPNLGEGRVGAGEGSPIAVIPTTRTEAPGQPNQLMSRQMQHPVNDVAPGNMPVLSSPSAAELNGPGANPSQPPLTAMPIASNNEQPSPLIGSLSNPPANLPAVKIVQAQKVRIDFTVGKFGPSGLGNADVYVTLDRGATWRKMPEEVPINLPPNTDLRGEVSGFVGVQLPAEGTIYGFIVAVKSKAGRAPPPPKAGDPPQALVELDTTLPQGNLFRPKLDPTQPNTLILAWEAKDRNLGPKPITLEWAEQKDGPWTPIGEASLPNTGQYPWRLPERLPPRVYLRLTMRDLAGNVSRAVTEKPELIDLSVPQTRIINVAPASR